MIPTMSWQFPKKAGIGRRSPYPLRQLHLKEGEAVYEQGDSNGALYLVVSGTVHLSLPRRRDSSDPVVLGPGAIFGQAGLFSGAVRRDSATAVTEVVLDLMQREDALKLLERHDESTQGLLAGLFDQAEQPMSRAPEEDRPDAAPDGPGATTDSSDAITEGSDVTTVDPDATIAESQPVRLLLKPSSRPLAAWIGREPIEITRLPFIVGRQGEGEDGKSNDNIDLVLADEKPYQLSRQHFAIDTCNGELVIRDSGSYHGTTVNSQRIGNDRRTNMVPLHLGENSIIAGSTDSPYCFTLLIEAA